MTVFFPVIFPDGATGSELSDLPEEYNAVADGKIKAADCTGNIVLDDSANLYKGELNDWFYTPDELTVTFTVVTGEGENAVSDDYEVTFSNATRKRKPRTVLMAEQEIWKRWLKAAMQEL